MSPEAKSYYFGVQKQFYVSLRGGLDMYNVYVYVRVCTFQEGLREGFK
jgi:hypothetical protein